MVTEEFLIQLRLDPSGVQQGVNQAAGILRQAQQQFEQLSRGVGRGRAAVNQEGTVGGIAGRQSVTFNSAAQFRRAAAGIRAQALEIARTGQQLGLAQREIDLLTGAAQRTANVFDRSAAAIDRGADLAEVQARAQQRLLDESIKLETAQQRLTAQTNAAAAQTNVGRTQNNSPATRTREEALNAAAVAARATANAEGPLRNAIAAANASRVAAAEQAASATSRSTNEQIRERIAFQGEQRRLTNAELAAQRERILRLREELRRLPGGGLRLGTDALNAEGALEQQNAILREQQETVARLRQRNAVLSSVVRTNEGQLAVDRQILGTVQDQARLELRERAIQGQINQIKRRAAQEELAALTRQGAGGTRFQRAQARFQGARGGDFRAPQEFESFGQFLGNRALTTAGFAIGGAALFSGINGVREVVREADELERELALLEAQYENITLTANSVSFDEFREQILQTARDTGFAADTVASTAQTFLGVSGDTQQAAEDLRSALELTAISGLSFEEVRDSLVALGAAFDEVTPGVDVSLRNVGDAAFAIQERVGVASTELIQFAADVAPAAADAALTFEQTLAIGSQQLLLSGRGGAALAESLGRVLPALREQSSEILAITQDIFEPQEQQDLAVALAVGETGPALLQLVEGYDRLTTAQQNQLIATIGGRREAQAIIPIFERSAEIQELLADTSEFAGTQAERFADRQRTLGQQLRELGQTATQLGIALFESGIDDFLSTSITLATLLADAFLAVVGAVDSLNDQFGGLPGQIAAITATVLGLNRAIQALSRTSAGAAVGRAVGVQASTAGRAATFTGLAGAATGRPLGAASTTAAATGTRAASATRLAGLARGVGVAGLAYAGINSILDQVDRRQQDAVELAEVVELGDADLEARIAELETEARRNSEGTFQRVRRLNSDGNGFTQLVTNLTEFSIGILNSVPLLPDVDLSTTDQERLEQAVQERTERELDGFRATIRAFSDAISTIPAEARERGVSRTIEFIDAEGNTQIIDAGTTQLDQLSDELVNLAGELSNNELLALAQFFGVGLDLEAVARARVGEVNSDFDQLRLDNNLEGLQSDFQNFDPERANEILNGIDNEQALAVLDNQARLLAGDFGVFQELTVRTGETQEAVGEAIEAAAQTLEEAIEENRLGLIPDRNLRAAYDEAIANIESEIALLEADLQTLETAEDPERFAAIQAAIDEARLRLANIQVDGVAFLEGQVQEALTRRGRLDSLLNGQNAGSDGSSELRRLQAAFNTPGISEDFRTDLAFQIAEAEQALAQAEVDRLLELDRTAEALELAEQGFTVSTVGVAEVLNRVTAVAEAEAQATALGLSGDAFIAFVDAALQRRAAAALSIAQQGIAFLDAVGRRVQQSIVETTDLINGRGVTALDSLDFSGGLDFEFPDIGGGSGGASSTRDELAEAIFNRREAELAFIGDEVGIAELGVERAQAALDFARRTGQGEAAITNAQADLIDARRNLNEVALANQLEELEFAFEFDELGQDAYVAELEALLASGTLRADQVRDVRRRLRSLRDDVTSDLRLNTPSDIDLPTLYEVRRLAQVAAAGGSGFQDNRTQNISLSAGNVLEGEAAVNFIVQQMEGDNRNTDRVGVV